MIDRIKVILFNNWNLSRFLRLGLGVTFIFQYFYQKDFIVLFLAITLILQALFNVGCASGNCQIDSKPLNKTQPESDIQFEEIKQDHVK
jgi:uncharacterized membrane protein HdeD (DUF308 family)